MPVNSNQKAPKDSWLDVLLLSQRFAMEKAEISTNAGRILIFFACLQSVASLLHLIDDPGMQVYQKFLCFLSPSVFMQVVKSASPINHLIVISVVLLFIPTYFALMAILELRLTGRGRAPPKIFHMLKNDYPSVKFVLYVLIYLAFVPVVEIVTLCLVGPPILPRNQFSPKLVFLNDLISKVQSHRLYILLLSLSIINLIVYGVFMLTTALLTYPRRFIFTNALTNDSKLSMFFNLVKRSLLGICLLVGLSGNIAYKEVLAIGIFVANCILLAVGYILPTFYDINVFEFVMSLNLTECCLCSILLFLNGMVYMQAPVWIDANLLALLLILSYMVAQQFQQWKMDRLVSLDKESSSVSENLLKYNMMFFKLKGSFDGDRLPEKSKDPFLQNTLSKIRNHFMSCLCQRCFCYQIRTA
jgi:hypothetical protein